MTLHGLSADIPCSLNLFQVTAQGSKRATPVPAATQFEADSGAFGCFSTDIPAYKRRWMTKAHLNNACLISRTLQF